MKTSKPTEINNETRKYFPRHYFKITCGLMFVATALYLGAVTQQTTDRLSGIAVFFGVGIILIHSGIVCFAICALLIKNRYRLLSIGTTAPLLLVVLPLLIGFLFAIYVWNPHIAEQRAAEELRLQAYKQTLVTTTVPVSVTNDNYNDGNIFIPNLYRSSQHHRPIDGLSFKSNSDFGNTFEGQKQFVITATNQSSGQAIGIYAVYTDACAAKWQRYPDGNAPDHLAKVGATLLAGDLPYGEYQCIGLQLSAPLKVGQSYISIEPNVAGSPVELAELPQLINVITNAQPAKPE